MFPPKHGSLNKGSKCTINKSLSCGKGKPTQIYSLLWLNTMQNVLFQGAVHHLTSFCLSWLYSDGADENEKAEVETLLSSGRMSLCCGAIKDGEFNNTTFSFQRHQSVLVIKENESSDSWLHSRVTEVVLSRTVLAFVILSAISQSFMV